MNPQIIKNRLYEKLVQASRDSDAIPVRTNEDERRDFFYSDDTPRQPAYAHLPSWPLPGERTL